RPREDLDEIVRNATYDRGAQNDIGPPGRPPGLEHVVDETALDDEGHNDQWHSPLRGRVEHHISLQTAYPPCFSRSIPAKSRPSGAGRNSPVSRRSGVRSMLIAGTNSGRLGSKPTS